MIQINPTSFAETCNIGGENRWLFLRCLLGAIHCTCLISFLCFKTACGGQYCYLHFISRELEPQRGYVSFLSSHSQQVQSHDLNQVCLLLNLMPCPPYHVDCPWPPVLLSRSQSYQHQVRYRDGAEGGPSKESYSHLHWLIYKLCKWGIAYHQFSLTRHRCQGYLPGPLDSKMVLILLSGPWNTLNNIQSFSLYKKCILNTLTFPSHAFLREEK